MAQRPFYTSLTPRACRALLNEHLATPFLTWFSKSGVDGRTDEHSFDIWLVGYGAEHRVGHLTGHYQLSPYGTQVVTEFRPPWPKMLLPSPLDLRASAAEQEALLITFLMRTLKATEWTGEEST
jgi:hypothetical protein